MVRLLVGHKGNGKTKKMIETANDLVNSTKGSIIFINKNSRLNVELNHGMRVVCMEDYAGVTNSDEYIGFIYGIISSDHDIDTMFIDGLLKHADVSLENLPVFIDRLKNISKSYELDFVVSLSATLEEMKDVDFADCEIMN